MHDNFENPHMFMGTFLWDIYYKPLHVGLSVPNVSFDTNIANPRPNTVNY